MGLAVADRVARRPVGRLARENSVHGGRGLHPCSRVDDVACDHRLAFRGAGADIDERLPGVDGDPHLKVGLLRAPVTDRKRRPHRPLRIVLMRDGRAEDRHHRVADELLDGSSTALELVAEVSVIRGKHRAHVLGIELLRPRREADEVDEDDGDGLSLLAERTFLRLERGRAGVAEAGRRRILLSAVRARNHSQSLRRARPSVTSDAGHPQPQVRP